MSAYGGAAAAGRSMTGKKHVHRSDDDNIMIKPEQGTSRAYTLGWIASGLIWRNACARERALDDR